MSSYSGETGRSSSVMPASYQGLYLGDLTKPNTPLFNTTNRYQQQVSVESSSRETPLYEESYRQYHTIDQNVVAGSDSPFVGPVSHEVAAGAVASAELTDFEAAILRSHEPIHIDETDEIEVAGARGIWANKSEVLSWPGGSIESYAVNEDPHPEIVTKKTSQAVEYVQEMAIRYLKPPTPEPPGDIIITEEANVPTIPAPPVIIRQQPPRPRTPEPIVFREAPPTPPPRIGRKVITITGKKLPPPPRKVIIERLAPLPEKPRAVLVERWLPYTTTKRRVIYNRPAASDPVVVKPRNVVVQWEAPQVNIRREVRYLGVVRANPAEYAQRYGSQMRQPNDMPSFINEIKTPEGIELAAHRRNSIGTSAAHELYGDVEALRLVDLEREGLAEYRDQLYTRVGGGGGDPTPTPTQQASTGQAAPTAAQNGLLSTYDISATIHLTSAPLYRGGNGGPSHSTLEGLHHRVQRSGVAAPRSPSIQRQMQQARKAAREQTSTSTPMTPELIDRVVNLKPGSRLSVEEAEKTLLRVSSQLKRRIGQEDVKLFFATLDVKTDGTVDSADFKSALLKVYTSQQS